MPKLEIEIASIGRWSVAAVSFANETRRLRVPVIGYIANSIYTSPIGKQKLIKWKERVAGAVKAKRGPRSWNPSCHYAISIGFSFYLRTHGNSELDVENYIKPTVDALAAGLFCENDQDVSSIKRFDFDDSNFRFLFIHRLPDALSADEEGTAISVSAKAQLSPL